jgi:hypothetical protein
MRSSLVALLFAGTLTVSFASVAACGSSDGGSATVQDDASSMTAPLADGGSNDAADARAAQDGGTSHVTAPALPVVPNQGGPILASPEIVTVTWSGDPIATDLEAFDAWWAPSATWKAIMAEWGVGAGTYVASARLTSAAPATLSDDDLHVLLQSLFDAGTLPAPNGHRLYMIYPPAGTVVTSFGAIGCEAFQAYHSALDVTASDAGPAAKAIYAVTPRCADTSGFSALDFVTWGSSHEAMEAASDPIAAQPAWRIDTQSLATPEPGENADLCAGQPVKIEGHMITRNWSNVAAKAGERPCVPAPPGPMFGLFADPGEVTVKPGSKTTVTLRAYSAAAYPSFAVGVFAADATLTATLSAKKAVDGDVLTLTVSASPAYVEQLGTNLVFLEAQSADYTTKRHLIVHAAP